jgi:hypothetical protein
MKCILKIINMSIMPFIKLRYEGEPIYSPERSEGGALLGSL